MEANLSDKRTPQIDDTIAADVSLKHMTFADWLFHAINYTVLCAFAICVLYPIVYIFSCSLSSAQAIIQNRVWLWPVDITISAYKTIAEHRLIVSGFFNSLWYSAAGTVVAVVLVLLTAYPLSRSDMPGRGIFMFYFAVTMFFGGGMIPGYILVRDLGMLGSRWSMIIPFAFSCYNVIIARTFFTTSIPGEMLEAAKVDGCTDIKFFWYVVLPLSKPVISVLILFNAVGRWNGYMSGLLYLTKPNTFNLQLVLRDILFISQMPRDMLEKMDPDRLVMWQNLMQIVKYAVIFVGAVPMMILYPFIQKYFVKGVMIGAIKG